jgi:hypothetical protein
MFSSLKVADLLLNTGNILYGVRIRAFGSVNQNSGSGTAGFQNAYPYTADSKVAQILCL